ncbi:MAG TPA: hypothetical protein VJP59_03365 [Gemmatimonadota bacterium]|nr:hypothetical protein [Gemmatimonadota bacterium]
MSVRMSTQVKRPPSTPGVPPRYQVFDRRTSPPMTVARFYFDPGQEGVVFEVYDDEFREFLKRTRGLAGKRFDWMLDVAVDAPHDTRRSVVRPHPMPEPMDRGGPDDPPLTLEEAVRICEEPETFRVVRASDPR